MTAAKRIADLKATHVLQASVPLSRSRLWEFERAYYERQGLRAWGEGDVPSAITSNPIIAAAYAEVIVAFLRDCAAAGQLDRGRRVHVLELGSGSGRLAHGLVRHLRRLLAATPLADQPVTVVLSDFDGAKLEQLAAHPGLAEPQASGWVDFAVVDAAAPGEVRTWRTQEVVAHAPLVVVANYVFDSLPTEAYAIRGGVAHDVGLTLMADAPELDRLDPKALSRLRLSWDTAEGPAQPTGRPEIDAVLAAYAAQLDSTMVLVPTAALACLDRLATAAGAPTLALVADKGWAHVRDLVSLGEPVVVPDGGSFSVMVNFDALARVVQAGGGTALLPSHQPQHLVVGAFVLGGLAATETARCYADRLAEAGPDDMHGMRGATKPAAELTLHQALGLLRTSRYDSRTFVELFPTLYEQAATATSRAIADLALAVQRVTEAWFPIGEPADVSLYLGLLLSRIGHHREALPMFAASLLQLGPNPEAHFGAARAHLGLRELAAALAEVRAALALNPGFDLARSLALELEAELVREREADPTPGNLDTTHAAGQAAPGREPTA